MKFNFFLKAFVACVILVFSASCDRDINEIGSGVIGDDHYGLNVYNSDVVAYNQSIGAVQTNDLPVNQFGFYKNPVFGKTTASFFSEVALGSTNPDFYSPTIDSVYLYVPYYSTLQSTDTDTGDSTYELDSIQGPENQRIKLSIYESDYAITNNPTAGLNQLNNYYSNQGSEFEAKILGSRLNNNNGNAYDHTVTNDNSQNDQFEFSKKQIKFYKKNADGTAGYTEVRERKAPGMLVHLDPAFFTNKIFNAPAGKLFNNNVFKEYFRGLHFKVEQASGSAQGRLAMMNFSRGVITIVYKDNTSSTVATRIRKELAINLSGHTVNLLDNDNNFPGYVAPNTISGDHNLFLKGGNGSMAIIDLFKGEKNSANSQLNTMRSEKWIINEANLTFYIDKNAMTGAPEPNRICLYDLTNKRPLIDLYTDVTTSSTTKFNKQIYGGILMDNNSKIVNESNGERGTKYKIRLTNYIRTLVKNGGNTDIAKDSTNVRLGLVVTENVSVASNTALLSPFTTTTIVGSHQTKYVPTMSVVNPLGTILYGSNVPVTDPNYDKRLKLEIFYTKPE
jgi:hypothetical protein